MLLTTAEKERIFTDAIQSFYYNQRQMLDDDDFDKLKEDLAWEGSQVTESVYVFSSLTSTALTGWPMNRRQSLCVCLLRKRIVKEGLCVSVESQEGFCMSPWKTNIMVKRTLRVSPS